MRHDSLLAHGTVGYLMPLNKAMFQGIPGHTLEQYI